MNDRKFLQRSRGFSLIEVMIVVGLMSIIALMMNSFFSHYQKRSDYNQKRVEMLNQLENLERFIKRDVSQLDLGNQLIVLVDQAGNPCHTNCPGLRFRVSKTDTKVGEVVYATSCTSDPEDANQPKDLSQAVSTCIRCGKGTHAVIAMASGGKRAIYDLMRTAGGKYDRISAGSVMCMTLGADALLFNLSMGLVDETGNVKELKKTLYFPRKKAEGLQLLGR